MRVYYLQKIRDTVVTYLRHGVNNYFADFDPQVLTTSRLGTGPCYRLIFRTKVHGLLSDHEAYSRKLAKFLSRCWDIVEWEAGAVGSMALPEESRCPILPLDIVCPALDRVPEKLAPAMKWEIRRWVELPLRSREWSFVCWPDDYCGLSKNAKDWLIENQYLVLKSKSSVGATYSFTDKFVLACWDEALKYESPV